MIPEKGRRGKLGPEHGWFKSDLYAWADAFQTFAWEKAFPDPVVAKRQIGQLLALI